MTIALRFLAAAAAILAAGCACSGDPLIDRIGVSDAKYNSDMADCRKDSSGWFSFGSPVASCMEGKGYKVLMGNSGL